MTKPGPRTGKPTIRAALRCLVLIAAGVALAAPDRIAQAQSPSTPYAAAAGTVTEGARDVLKRVTPSVIQIRGFFGTNTAPAFQGSGFAIAGDGLFMTNYHVVAQQVHEPEKYRLEYRSVDGRTGGISVLAVDVRHDLAVVRAAGHAPAPLGFVPADPVKGARAYSVGFPLDVGLTITEGVSNGRIEDAFEQRIHYSGAINSGMSGGPTLNRDGEVIGVNVSVRRFSQLVSFLVPAEHAARLRDTALARTGGPDTLKRDIVGQMKAYSAGLLKALDGPVETQVSASYALPSKLAPFMDCSAQGRGEPDQPIQLTRINCSAKAGLYLQQGLSSGNIAYLHIIMTSKTLDAWRFAHQLSKTTTAAGRFGLRKHVGPYSCRTRVVGLKGFDASIVVCARAYREFDGLHDFTVRVTSLNGENHGFTSHLDLFGVDFDGGMDFIRRYTQAMEWKK